MEVKKGLLYKNRIVWHILFWIGCYLFFSITYGSYSDEYALEFKANAYLMPVRIIFTYLFVYYILAELLLKRRFNAFFIALLIHAMAYGLVIWLIMYNYIYCCNCIFEGDYPVFYWPKIFGSLLGNYQIPAIAALIFLFKRWYIDQQRKRSLEKDKLEAELKFLKSQIHPHFLFNTLNNLYALTLKKSDKAPDIVIKLSELLDYMLYNSNEEEVDLESEIKLINGYLELEKIRYGERLELNYQLKGDPSGKKIAPLILLPFIENSFKHGASKGTEKPFVDISLTIEDMMLRLIVSNSHTNNNKHLKEGYMEGIGLKNVKRRLELIYPEKHELKVESDHKIFKIILELHLNGK